MVQPITTLPELDDQNPLMDLSESQELEITSFIDPEDPMNEFVNAEEFSKAVHYHVQFYGTSIMEAIMSVAERIGLEPQHDTDQIKELLDSTLKSQLFMESVQKLSVRGELPSQLDV